MTRTFRRFTKGSPMSFRKVSLALLTGLALLVAGCGGDDGPTTQQTEPQPTGGETTAAEPTGADTGAPVESGDVTELGSITINGDVYAVTTLNRCASEFDDLDFQALGQGVKINLIGEAGSIIEVSVDGLVVEENYGSRSFGRFEVITDGTYGAGRTTGSVTLGDTYGTDKTVDVAWDIQVPDEERDCSL